MRRPTALCPLLTNFRGKAANLAEQDRQHLQCKYTFRKSRYFQNRLNSYREITSSKSSHFRYLWQTEVASEVIFGLNAKINP